MDGWEACMCVRVCVHECVCVGGLMSAHVPASVLTCMFVFLSACVSSICTCWRVYSFLCDVCVHACLVHMCACLYVYVCV